MLVTCAAAVYLLTHAYIELVAVAVGVAVLNQAMARRDFDACGGMDLRKVVAFNCILYIRSKPFPRITPSIRSIG